MFKKSLGALVLTLILLLTSCGSSYDEEALDDITEWANEIIPTVDVTLHELNRWGNGEISHRDLIEHKNKIKRINSDLWHGEMPDYEEIQEWEFRVTYGDNEWVVEGDNFAEAVDKTKFESEELARTIDEYIIEQRAEDINDLGEYEQMAIISIAEAAREGIEELRWELWRQ